MHCREPCWEWWPQQLPFIWDTWGGSLSSLTDSGGKNCNRLQPWDTAVPDTSKNKFSDHWLTCVTHLKDRKVRNRLNKKHNPTQLQWSWDKNFGVMAPRPANVFGWFLQCRIGFFSFFFPWVISNGSKDPVDQAPNLAFIRDNFWRS